MEMTTTIEEVEACQTRGYWYELVDPTSGDFWGRWLEARGAEEFRRRRLLMYGVALEVCRVELLSRPGAVPYCVQVQNLERPEWRAPR